MRLLLIDDSPDDRLLARRALLKDFADLEVEVGVVATLSGRPWKE